MFPPTNPTENPLRTLSHPLHSDGSMDDCLSRSSGLSPTGYGKTHTKSSGKHQNRQLETKIGATLFLAISSLGQGLYNLVQGFSALYLVNHDKFKSLRAHTQSSLYTRQTQHTNW